MLLFSHPSYAPLASALHKDIPGIRNGEFFFERYDNGEMHLRVEGNVSGEICVILSTIAPPDEMLLMCTLLAHTLRKEGARRVVAALPYLAYSRHDKKETGKSLGIAWVGSLFKASGIDEVITVDLHSPEVEELVGMPIHKLSSAQLFADEVRRLEWTDATFIAPDRGAIQRCKEVGRLAHMQGSPSAYFVKERTAKGIAHISFHGTVGERVILVDDILDTGETLLSATQKLVDQGAREIVIMVTHGLFTGTLWHGLWENGVQRIVCTNSVPLSFKGAHIREIKQLSIASLLAHAVQKLEREFAT